MRVLVLDRDHHKAKTMIREARIANEKLKNLFKKIGESEKRGDYGAAIAAMEIAIQLSDKEDALKTRKGRLMRHSRKASKCE